MRGRIFELSLNLSDKAVETICMTVFAIVLFLAFFTNVFNKNNDNE
jgi:hypothetical protein